MHKTSTLHRALRLCYSGISRRRLPTWTPGTPSLLLPCCWCDTALRAAPLHLPSPYNANPLVRLCQLPIPPYTYSASLSASSLSSSPVPSSSSIGMLPRLSLSVSLSSSLAARWVPDRGMNSRRRLAWNQPGTGNPSRVFREYELPARCTMRRGADHQGRSLRVVDSVMSREFS